MTERTSISRFFIDRPIFASVLSIVITLAGGIALVTLPIAMYPPISPPTIQVDCSYPGASAEIVSQTVATPIEQQVNGVENMLYMSSQCTNDGAYNLTVTFKHGVDLNMAQVLVQNRVSLAVPLLPDVIKQTGLTTRKKSPDILLALALVSPDSSYDQVYLSNYALLRVKEEIARLPGVGDIGILGQRDYSMRIWVDPEKLAARDMTAYDVANAVRKQNALVSTGQIGQPPIPEGQVIQVPLSMLGRLVEPEQFGNIIIKQWPGDHVVRLKDVARIELGSKNQDISCSVNLQPAITLAVFQLPDANALDVADVVKAKIEELKKSFPPGIDYQIRYDTTPFIRESIGEVYKTLFEAVILVAVVVLLFLQNWRSAVIPLVAVPVAVIGTFAVLAAMGFTLNNLTLFGLVLAIGIVVDDAIVVVEAVEHHIEHGMAPRDATIRAMDEVSGPVIAIGLVLSAVFIPCAFITGIVGQFFRQFALTIATSTLISAFNSLTLSPALAALLIRPRTTGPQVALPRVVYAVLAAFAAFMYLPEIVATRVLSQPGADLRLMPSLKHTYEIPTTGKDLIIIAAVEDELHFRMFDGAGKVVEDGDEKRLTKRISIPELGPDGKPLMVDGKTVDTALQKRRKEQARQIDELKKELAGLWPPHVMSASEESRVIAAVTEILEQSPEPSGESRAVCVAAGAVGGWLLGWVVDPCLVWFFGVFNAGFRLATRGYSRLVGLFLKGSVAALMVYGGLLYLTFDRFQKTPAGFIPTQDMGYLLANVQLPDSYSLEETRRVLDMCERIAKTTDGVLFTQAVTGQSLLLSANGSNFGSMFCILDPFEKRRYPQLYSERVIATLKNRFRDEVPEAMITVLGPPPVRGVGRAGGFKFMVEDRGDSGSNNLQVQADALVAAAKDFRRDPSIPIQAAPLAEEVKQFLQVREETLSQKKEYKPDPSLKEPLTSLVSTFRANVPQFFVNVNRGACMTKEVRLQDLFDTLRIYLGSLYVNDFNLFGRTWQVIIQADSKFRNQIEYVPRLKVRNSAGLMVPVGTLAAIEPRNGPLVLTRYNMYPAAPINGAASPGVSSGDAISVMQTLAELQLPETMAPEWTELAFLEIQAGNTAMIVFGFAVVMVFLVLAAQYESWSLPMAIIMVVPMCLLSAVTGVNIAGEDVNIFTQIGFVVLVGLASKNAILIVEFAKQRRDAGESRRQAALDACALRLRPIIMTSFAFILGVLPLLTGHGAGAEMRRTLGTTVFSGMIGVTIFGIFLTPVFFYAIDWLGETRLFASPMVRRIGGIPLAILSLRFLRGSGRPSPRPTTPKPSPLPELEPIGSSTSVHDHDHDREGELLEQT